jgi:hypothetical protein
MRHLKAYLAIVSVAVMQPTHASRTASDARVSASPLSQIARWTLEEPAITSAGGDAQTGAIFSRIVSVVRLRDGRILVWEPRPPSVRLFDAKGQFVRVFAREGSGPGEVRDAQWIATAGDTVLLFDKTQRRLTRLTVAGQRLATESFRAADDIGSTRSSVGGVTVRSYFGAAMRCSLGIVRTASAAIAPGSRSPIHLETESVV